MNRVSIWACCGLMALGGCGRPKPKPEMAVLTLQVPGTQGASFRVYATEDGKAREIVERAPATVELKGYELTCVLEKGEDSGALEVRLSRGPAVIAAGTLRQAGEKMSFAVRDGQIVPLEGD